MSQVVHYSQIDRRMTELAQTRTPSLGAARPLPPSADIGPGGQVCCSTCAFRLVSALTYCSGRSPDWLKMKNPACEAVRREAEEDWENGCLARICG
jgi:hypothetical protein